MMIDLIDRFKNRLRAREDVLRCFCSWGVQVEGWFKGEMLCFLSLEVDHDQNRIVQAFDREVPISGRTKVDFSVQLSSYATPETVWIELKHWLIGRQRRATYNATWYFSQPLNLATGIGPDLTKLSTIASGEKYVLIACTAAPKQDDWDRGLELLNRKLDKIGRQIKCLTDVSQCDEYLFFGLLHLENPRIPELSGPQILDQAGAC